MPTAASGSLSLAQENLRLSLADCPAVRTWLDALDQAEALERIYHEGMPEPEEGRTHTPEELADLRPCIVIYTAEQQGFSVEIDSAGASNEYARSGRLVARLYQNCPESYGDEPTSDANLQFRNTVGAIIDDLCELSGTAGYLSFANLSVQNGPYWNHPKAAEAQGVWQGVELAITWRGQ